MLSPFRKDWPPKVTPKPDRQWWLLKRSVEGDRHVNAPEEKMPWLPKRRAPWQMKAAFAGIGALSLVVGWLLAELFKAIWRAL